MNDHDYIYGAKPKTDELVVVKVCVPKRLKTRLESLKLLSGRNIQDMATEAIESYLAQVETQVRTMAAPLFDTEPVIAVQAQ